MSSTLSEQLSPYFLLGGYNAAELWPTIDVVGVSYALLVFTPRWKWTPALTLITPIFHSLIYVGSLFSILIEGGGMGDTDMNSFEGVVTFMKDPNVLFPAWIHYIAFDLLVSRMITIDSVDRGASNVFHIFAILPCIGLTLMFGPTGFLLYIILRQIFLPATSASASGTKYKIL